MQIKNTAGRYGSVAMLLHWLMALLLIGLLGLGLYMTGLPLGLQKLKFYGWHKEFGILVLMLVIARVAWRVLNITPILPTHMPTWERFAANSAHYVFYLLMFALPITGWMMSSASGLPVSFFGVFVLPDLVSQNDQLQMLFIEIHKWLGYGLITILCVHIAAALQHHFIYKDDILRRMLP